MMANGQGDSLNLIKQGAEAKIYETSYLGKSAIMKVFRSQTCLFVGLSKYFLSLTNKISLMVVHIDSTFHLTRQRCLLSGAEF